MESTAQTERDLLRALGVIRDHWAALTQPSGAGTGYPNSVGVWDNWNAPGGATNTLRGLTNSSDLTRERLGMKPTGLLPTRPLDPDTCASIVSSDRWISKVDTTSGDCHTWTAATNNLGYGWIGVGRSAFLAHRISYVADRGTDIPAGYVIDHLCRRPSCVNPAHLEAVSTRTNTLRGLAPAADQARRSECPKGHPIDGPDCLRRDGHRECLACKKARDRERANIERRAMKILGLTQKEYRKRYGSSIATSMGIVQSAEEEA